MLDNSRNIVTAGLWLVALLWLLVMGGPKDPPSAPSAASHYEAQVDCTLGFPPDDATPAPLTYEDRFSADALGDWAYFDAASSGHCPVSRSAVNEQGVGE